MVVRLRQAGFAEASKKFGPESRSGENEIAMGKLRAGYSLFRRIFSGITASTAPLSVF
jgi:hypothetical protein